MSRATPYLKNGRVSIREVADHAGCGIATVSRVLNGSGPASVSARERVMASAQVLGFQISDIGRSLRTQRTRTIGCIVPSIANPVFAEALQGLQRTAQLAGYQVIVSASDYCEQQEFEAARTMIGKQVDAMVLTVSDPKRSQALRLIDEQGLPRTLIFNHLPTVAPQAAVDNRAAAALVADAFVERGHSRLGFLALRFGSSDRSKQRFEGFAARCRTHEIGNPMLIEIDGNAAAWTESLPDLLAANRALSGLFASNDLLALAAMQAARTIGLRIPHDLSIVGFDGIAMGRMVEPTLATVQTDALEMGARAAELVLAKLEDQAPSSGRDHPGFHFRHGGSLGRFSGRNRADLHDDEEAATSSSSSPTLSTSLQNRKD